jgi:hypothetical protein
MSSNGFDSRGASNRGWQSRGAMPSSFGGGNRGFGGGGRSFGSAPRGNFGGGRRR